jgi:hypothetical protein
VAQGLRRAARMVAAFSPLPMMLQLLSRANSLFTAQLAGSTFQDEFPRHVQIGPGGWQLLVVVIAWGGWAALSAVAALARWRYLAAGTEPPGVISIEARRDERPGLKWVRAARRSALAARAAIESIDTATRDLFVTAAFEALDRSVWEMARAATQSSDPDVLADLRARSVEAEAVARDSEVLRRQLLEELPAFRSTAVESMITPVVRTVLENVRADMGVADEAVRAMTTGLEEARAAGEGGRP